jgi:tRNA1Val (adenine37-N6)-methyltransferase
MSEPAGWPADATLDALVGDWKLYQRSRGHKTSTDDVLTACLAFRAANGTPPSRYLDLGCGIGSVLFMTAHALRPRSAVGIEAQAQSAAMATASVAGLPDSAPEIQIRQGDFRTALTEADAGAYDLVTGSPPYFPVGSGTLPADYQRRACRFELRGGVEAYCEAAAGAMTPEARFVLVFQTEWDARVLAAGEASGLHLHHRTDTLMRTDRTSPFLSIYTFGRAAQPTQTLAFAIRDAEGHITPEYTALRAEIGLTTKD